MPLVTNSYGKSRVRIMRVQRNGDHHHVCELSVTVMLHGEFERAYTHADNSRVIATDTIKNIVNVVARENVAVAPELFAEILAARFLQRYRQVDRVVVTTRETRWTRMELPSGRHSHSFVLDANGTPVVRLEGRRDGVTLRSGIDCFTFMKSTGSGWTDYVQDEFTTLRPTQDRIAATAMTALWSWSSAPPDYIDANIKILHAMLDIFATTYSHGIQDSLYRMAESALAATPHIADIELSCPNKHYLPIDLSSFGVSGDNLVFTPTDEPHGQIECRLAR